MINFKNNSKLKVLIPLRGGSKGIKKKNLKYFNGKPLFTWVTNSALETNLEVFISTEDEEIKENIKLFCPLAKIIDRPKELATDDSSTEEVISHFIKSLDCDHIVLLQATSPLTKSSDISLSIDKYFSNNCKPLVSGTRQHIFIWNNDGYSINYDPSKRPRRQEWEGTFIENGAIYIFKVQDFKLHGTRCKAPCTLFEMSQTNAIELDNNYDWIALENIIETKDK